MSGIDIIPYALVAAVVLASILSLVLLGGQAWVVPVVALPPAIAYLVYDRRAKQREGGSGG